MHFAFPLPLWLVALVIAAIAAVAFLAYRRPLAPLRPFQRGALVALRAAGLSLVAIFLCRPVVLRPPAAAGDIVVPILLDVSRSMAVADAGGRPRIARAVQLLRDEVLPAVSRRFAPEVYAVGSGLAPLALDRVQADANQSDLIGALDAARDRYRGRRTAGIVLVSDGGVTERAGVSGLSGVPPVFAVGVGSTSGVPDREVVGLTAGDPRLDQASIDLQASVVSRGFGRAPFDVRVLANGRQVDTRRVVPAADGTPVDFTTTLVPDRAAPTVYTVEIPQDPGESIGDNNARSVLVGPPGRKRRVLVLEGAPGFEHSFLTRALGEDSAFEVDVVVRKGKTDAGQDTFMVQAAAPGRAASLTSGFPARREDLYSYDALIVANIEGDSFSRVQLGMAADFVAERGGGLLALGGRSFAEHGLIGTPLEPVLPVELGDRRSALARSSFGADLGGAHDTVALTPEGEAHPVMRLGASLDETRARWKAMPALAASAPLGGPRPGATVLAVTVAPGGAVYPVVAAQRYGQGRSLVFGGEGAWRWRMLQPSTDRTYELFWRQAVRWLAGPAPDPVEAAVPDAAQPGDWVTFAVDARDGAFVPVRDATVTATISVPDGDSRPLTLRRESASGRFTTAFRAEQKGLYRLHAEAKRGERALGAADRWFYVGGADRELADPRLNDGTLRRIARATGGRYVDAASAGQVASWLDAGAAESADLEQHDLWQEPWALALLVSVLSAEWILRRRWGLR